MANHGAAALGEWLSPESRSEDLAELARAEWGLWAEELDEIAIAQLAAAYIRRKRAEGRILAAELGRLFGGAGPSSGPQGGGDRVDSSELLRMMGIDGD